MRAALAVLLLVPCAVTANAAEPDFRRAWACDSRAKIDDVDVTVIRELDEDGKQLSVTFQWHVDPPRPFTVSLSGMADKDGSGDPPLRLGVVHAAWKGRAVSEPEQDPPVAVLHAPGASPVAAQGKPRIHYSDGLFGGSLPWPRVSALMRSSDRARLSLVDRKGAVVESWSADLRAVRKALSAVAAGLKETSWQAKDHRERCSEITEWMRL